MSEKGNHERADRRPEYLNAPGHIVELAEAVLLQIGERPDTKPAPGELARSALWRRDSGTDNELIYILERYDYDVQSKRYLLDVYRGEEVIDSYVFRSRGPNDPKFYRPDARGHERELHGHKLENVQDQLRDILGGVNGKATSHAEKVSSDKEFERIVGRYILSDLAHRPLGAGEDGAVHQDASNRQVDRHNGHVRAIEKIALLSENGKSAVDRAIKNPPDPHTDSRFISLDVSLSAAMTAHELGNEWTNTFDTSKAPGDRIPKPPVEETKELVTLEQPLVTETPENNETTDSDSE